MYLIIIVGFTAKFYIVRFSADNDSYTNECSATFPYKKSKTCYN